jgi:hypothetical protein
MSNPVAQFAGRVYRWIRNPQRSKLFGERTVSELFFWRCHARGARALSVAMGRHRKVDPDFASTGMKYGRLSQEHLAVVLDVLAKAPPTRVVNDDYAIGYISHPFTPQAEAKINKNSTYYYLSPAELEALAPVLESFREPVAACYGSPWRILNVRSWVTHADAEQYGPNEWHTDGLVPQVWKVMIYPGGVGPDRGTTEILGQDGTSSIVDGPPGTWLLFKPTLRHRGIPPTRGERMLLELIVAPSFQHDQRPLAAGLNAHYPSNPWFRPREHQRAVPGARVGASASPAPDVVKQSAGA